MRKAAVVIVIVGFACCVFVLFFTRRHAAGMPALELRFSHYQTNQGSVSVVLCLTNKGTETAVVARPVSRPDLVMYSPMGHSPTGWVHLAPDYGSAAGHPSILPPGGSTTFSVPMLTNETWKIGVYYTTSSFETKVGSIAPRLWRRYHDQYSNSTSSFFDVWTEPIGQHQ